MTIHTLCNPSAEVVGQLLLINDESGLGEPLKQYLEDCGFVVKMANNATSRSISVAGSTKAEPWVARS